MWKSVFEKVLVGVIGGVITSIGIWFLAQTGTLVKTVLGPELTNSAIVAFDGDCPTGWKPYERASGRFIVSSGSNRDKNGDIKEFAFGQGADDGEYRHKLTELEMPAHTHTFQGSSAPLGGWAGGVVRDNLAVSGALNWGYYTPSGNISSTGGNEPHNNVPPYFALQFCTKA